VLHGDPGEVLHGDPGEVLHGDLGEVLHGDPCGGYTAISVRARTKVITLIRRFHRLTQIKHWSADYTDFHRL
jgi:hypothetical protein